MHCLYHSRLQVVGHYRYSTTYLHPRAENVLSRDGGRTEEASGKRAVLYDVLLCIVLHSCCALMKCRVKPAGFESLAPLPSRHFLASRLLSPASPTVGITQHFARLPGRRRRGEKREEASVRQCAWDGRECARGQGWDRQEVKSLMDVSPPASSIHHSPSVPSFF